MLDLVGYVDSLDLGADTLVEPGCGDGAFLSRIVPRLLSSAEKHGRSPSSLGDAIRAYEIDAATADVARLRVIRELTDANVPASVADRLAQSWIVTADFLLDQLDVAAKWVVGNPPYVRVEEAPPETYIHYRSRWKLMSGRADIYIGFYEAALALLQPDGKLCFICADRWMHNQYGASLRRHIVENFAMDVVLELHRSKVFDTPVAAYPAVTLISRTAHTKTVLATANEKFSSHGARRFVGWSSDGPTDELRDEQFTAAVLHGSFAASESWPSGPPERLRLISDLEARVPSLDDSDIRIGVGIATGADRVYVTPTAPDVEKPFLKRAVGPADLRSGQVSWSGRWLVSPWIEGELADLDRYPRLARYFNEHAEVLKTRFVARKRPDTWWRTIDRPPTDEYRGNKLIVADINDRIEPILDRSGYWPLHSAYFIQSNSWDLEALGGYLLSDVAAAFVEAYSVKMASGHLRISAQYLRKIRIPAVETVTPESLSALISAFRSRDRLAASAAAREILELN